MESGQAAVMTALVVTVGRWVERKPLSVNIIVGGAGIAIGLALLSEADSELASQFATLILVTATLTYGVKIAEALNKSTKAKQEAKK